MNIVEDMIELIGLKAIRDLDAPVENEKVVFDMLEETLTHTNKEDLFNQVETVYNAKTFECMLLAFKHGFKHGFRLNKELEM